MDGLNVKKNRKGHRTVHFSPFGRLPLRDAAQSVTVTLRPRHIKRGKRNMPSACALALCIRDAAEDFPGRLIAAYVGKTYTLVASEQGERLRAVRYAHPEGLRTAINGFDKTAKKTGLTAGSEIMLLAPTGARQLGESKGRSNAGNIIPRNPRQGMKCVRRGVFVDPLHGKMAVKEIGQKSVLNS